MHQLLPAAAWPGPWGPAPLLPGPRSAAYSHQTTAAGQDLGSLELGQHLHIPTHSWVTPPAVEPSAAELAAAAARSARDGPPKGLVAVKVQYPDALGTMLQDLTNVRLAAAFLQKFELKFDLVSAVRELAAQVRLSC